jgi:hypothetical protein
MKSLACSLVLVVAAAAHADPLDPALHLDAGVELEARGDVSSVAFRGQALVGNSFGSGAVRPELAAGGLFGAGTLYAPDPRAVFGSVGASVTTLGPELQAGVAFYDHEGRAARLFASVAYLHVGLDSRLMIDPVPGIRTDSTHGERGALGVNFAGAEAHHATCETKNDCGGILLFILPQQLEFAVERDAGTTRYGATLSWGI